MSQESKTSKKRPRRSFTEEFKRDAVNLVAVEGYAFNRAALAVGVSVNSLRRWYEKYVPEPEACGEDATFQQLQEENQRLRKKLREAEMEREILKKATAFFAKESQ
jgi:transposase